VKGDFSRILTDRTPGQSMVLFQQGAPIVDADLNRAGALLLDHLRTVVTDVVGWHGTPREPDGGPGGFAFGVEAGAGQYTAGRYYINGLLCEAIENGLTGPVLVGPHIVYLEAWERDVNPLDGLTGPGGATRDEIRDVALRDVASSLRSEVVWRIAAAPVGQEDLKALVHGPDPLISEPDLLAMITKAPADPYATVVEMRLSQDDTPSYEPCVLPPDAGYRGTENQLYRFELREVPRNANVLELAWARDNASVIYEPAEDFLADGGPQSGQQVKLASAVDDRTRLVVHDLVEVRTDGLTAAGVAGDLFALDDADPGTRTITLGQRVSSGPPRTDEERATDGPGYLRRWDGFQQLSPSASPVDLVRWRDKSSEFGLQVAFRTRALVPATDTVAPTRRGDHWLAPARSGAGIVWPTAAGGWQAPHGIRRHRAPLAVLDGGTVKRDLRRGFSPVAGAVMPPTPGGSG
jgi:hypothetical protein